MECLQLSIVIIGILIAIAIPIYGGIQARARDNSCDANIRTIRGAVAIYISETGAATGLAGDVDEDHVLLTGDGDEVGPLLESPPVCPWDGESNYVITVDAEGNASVACGNGHPAE